MLRRFAVLFAVLFIGSFSTACHSVYAKGHKAPPPAQTGAQVQVWVNLKTGIYHYPSSRWYGQTKEGAYMSEDAAKQKGYRAAENGQ